MESRMDPHYLWYAQENIYFFDYALKATPFGKVCQIPVSGRSQWQSVEDSVPETAKFAQIIA